MAQGQSLIRKIKIMSRTFVGFGFGPIQAGLFLYEASRSGNFSRLVAAEVVPEVVEAVRRRGAFRLNVATAHGIERHEVPNVEVFNPRVAADREALVEAVAEASEIGTALPSVNFYGSGKPGDIIDILMAGLQQKTGRAGRPAAVIYTAENHNHAAEILEKALEKNGLSRDKAAATWQCLNTVVGKMSGAVTDPAQIAQQSLFTMAEGLPRAFLVEEFNRILITRIELSGFRRGIEVFEEKPDLLPFEEAKLYGHNAAHALLGYLLRRKGSRYMADARQDRALLAFVREAFLEESGRALCRKYAGLDPLFTEAGYQAYVEDLLERMLNPHLLDTVERITRDPRRKLNWDDRLIGTVRLALGQGVEPRRFACGAAAAVEVLAGESGTPVDALLDGLWTEPGIPSAEAARVRDLVRRSGELRA